MSGEERRETVPAGYKMTEVGVIPKDWRVAALGDIGTFKNGINKSESDFGTGYPFINLLDVFGQTNLSRETVNLGLVKTSAGEREAYDIRSGDVLFVRSSVKPEGVGLTALIENSFDDTVFSGFLIRFRASAQLDHRFKRYCFLETGFRKRLMSSSTVSANTNINQVSLARLRHAFPRNKAEQHAIAEALSDVDNLLDALDRLIAKKRVAKQAVMQQLLTGKTRLPGFAGEWEETTLGEHVEFLNNGSQSRSQLSTQGSVRYVHYGDIHMLESPYLDLSRQELPFVNRRLVENLRRLRDGDLVLADASEDLQGVGKAVEMRSIGIQEVVSGLHTLVARFDSERIAKGFPAYLQFHSGFRRQLERLASGTKVYAVTSSQIGSIQLLLPPLPEQRAIAEVLSDMDEEIAALEKRRDKTRSIKDGMMQQLLTGRVRLVTPTATHNQGAT